MKIYISGKISGLDEEFIITKFHYGRQELYQMGIKLDTKDVINPLDIKPFLGIKNWWCFMISDIYQLLKCDAIYMLDNWKDSRGARIELAIAILTKKKLYFQ